MRSNGHGIIYIGTAAWSIPKVSAIRMQGHGSHLQRYSRQLNAVEINSSFYRSHRTATYQRWAESTPSEFRFSAKVPKQITHECALQNREESLDRFLTEVTTLGEKLGPLLVQLPPSQAFERKVAQAFFAKLRANHAGRVACEPRHPSWFGKAANELLVEFQVARVAADPAIETSAAETGGWPQLKYFRLHGSPRIYYSDYSSGYLAELAAQLSTAARGCPEVWCIFDNTALGAATNNALDLVELLALRRSHTVSRQATA